MVDYFSVFMRGVFPSVFGLQPVHLIARICGYSDRGMYSPCSFQYTCLAWLKFEINLYQIAFRKAICYPVREKY